MFMNFYNYYTLCICANLLFDIFQYKTINNNKELIALFLDLQL